MNADTVKLLKQGFQITDHYREYFIYLSDRTGKYVVADADDIMSGKFDTLEEALAHFRETA